MVERNQPSKHGARVMVRCHWEVPLVVCRPWSRGCYGAQHAGVPLQSPRPQTVAGRLSPPPCCVKEVVWRRQCTGRRGGGGRGGAWGGGGGGAQGATATGAAPTPHG